ncbi:MAG: putative transposase, partial [Pseudoalteromonas tetraodonis]
RRGRGRPRTPCPIAELVVRMAADNPGWGYTRIRGALAKLGHEIAPNTVKRILQEHGIDPAPERSKRTSWKTFLQAHWEGMAATDLFTVEVLTLAGLRRYFVFFVIELKTRHVHIAGIHHQPYGELMEQAARNLTDAFDGFLRDATHLIHDRDPLFTIKFAEILKSIGVTPFKLPPRSPNLNADAERFVRSIKNECLSRVVVLGERHLRLLVREYVEHYHRERNHQGLENRLLSEPPPPPKSDAGVRRRRRVGGLLNYYHREAA